MNRMIGWVAGLAIGLSVAISVQAESLSDAIAKAWSRNPQAAASAAREAEAQARADVAAGITPGPPSISLSSTNDKLNRDRGWQELEVEMSVPIWVPGQKAAREAEASAAQTQVAAQRQALRLQIAGEVREAWWAVAAARNILDLAKRRVATAIALESAVLRRYKAGDLARVDANLVQGERLASEGEQIEAEAALLQTEQAFLALTGISAPTDLIGETVVPPGDPKDEHPQLLAVAANTQLAKAKLKVADETRRDAPEVAVRALRARGDVTESYADLIGVKLTIPFSSGPRVRQENSAARAELAQAEAEMALAQLRMRLDLQKVRLDLETAERQLATARQRRELAAENLALGEKSFALGESDLLTLLRIRASAFEAEALLNRQRVALEASQSRLNQALGVIP